MSRGLATDRVLVIAFCGNHPLLELIAFLLSRTLRHVRLVKVMVLHVCLQTALRLPLYKTSLQKRLQFPQYYTQALDRKKYFMKIGKTLLFQRPILNKKKK